MEMEFTGGTSQDSIRKCRLIVHTHHEVTLEAAVSAVRDQIKYRLTSSSVAASTFSDQLAEDAEEELEEAASDAVAEEDAEITNETTTEAAEEDEPLEMGRSLLMQLLAKLDDEQWCKANQKDIFDLARPATVIDGQHRITAAQQCERNIPFSVCAIFNCPWPEQVFQFTVVNYTAKGIPDQFITANAALSLTKPELSVLQDRLVQAGVKVTEYELMRIVQFDKESPFFELVNLTEKSNPNKIGYRSMVRLARVWYQGKHPAIQQLLQGLYPDITGTKATKKRIERWQLADWGIFFKDFWSSAAKIYSDVKSDETQMSLWTPGHSNLLIGVVLEELQEAFLDHLAQQDVDLFFTPTDKHNALLELRGRVEKRSDLFFGWVPAEFFASKWELKSLSIGPGRKALNDVLAQFVKSKGKYQYGKSAFLTGQIG